MQAQNKNSSPDVAIALWVSLLLSVSITGSCNDSLQSPGDLGATIIHAEPLTPKVSDNDDGESSSTRDDAPYVDHSTH